jgi:cell volume regulation protein A
MEAGTLILVTGVLLALSIAATLVAGRLRVPGLVLFLGLGMAIGSDGLGLIEFGSSMDDVELARTIGVIALALILFEGGLTAGWGEIRPVLSTGLALATVGTVLTALITGLAAHELLDLALKEGLLLGAIVAGTDAAAVFALLRGSGLRRRVARTLEAESGLNDPIAALLVIGFIDWIQKPSYDLADMLGLLTGQLAIGAAAGLAVGAATVVAFRRVTFATQGLYPVASMAAAALSFGAADALHGSGFLAVYLAGLVLGSARVPAKRTVEDFHAGVGWVSQIALFLTLGLLVFPSQLDDVALDGLLLAGVLAFVARPVAAFLSTRVGGFDLRESTLLSWAGLRGALPVVFATFPVIEGVPHANRFFNLVFFVVLTSALVQGATFEPLARALGLTTDERRIPRPFAEVGAIRRLGAEVLEYAVASEDAAVGRLVNELGLPREALVSVIVRGEQALLPRGSTAIEAGDRLHILVRQAVREEVEVSFERWRSGPLGEPEEAVIPLHGRAAIFSVRPWTDDLGDPGTPGALDGIGVARRLRARRDEPGALIQLEDGRYAVTGEGLVAKGGPRQLLRYCGERIRRASSAQARAWWEEVAGVLSQRLIR